MLWRDAHLNLGRAEEAVSRVHALWMVVHDAWVHSHGASLDEVMDMIDRYEGRLVAAAAAADGTARRLRRVHALAQRQASDVASAVTSDREMRHSTPRANREHAQLQLAQERDIDARRDRDKADNAVREADDLRERLRQWRQYAVTEGVVGVVGASGGDDDGDGDEGAMGGDNGGGDAVGDGGGDEGGAVIDARDSTQGGGVGGGDGGSGMAGGGSGEAREGGDVMGGGGAAGVGGGGLGESDRESSVDGGGVDEGDAGAVAGVAGVPPPARAKPSRSKRVACLFVTTRRRRAKRRVSEYGAEMAPSADAETRVGWPDTWLPPGDIAGRGAAMSRADKTACADESNWWWGPGREAGERARVWFRRPDGRWEEWFIVKESPVLLAAGVRLALGLFAARKFRNLHTIMYYTGDVINTADTAEDRQAQVDRAVRHSAGGRYIIKVGQNYIDGYNADRGNPAYLMNDLGPTLNNVRVDGGGAVVVGLVGERDYRPRTVHAGDEIAWDYGSDYWETWGGKRVGKSPAAGTGGGGKRRRGGDKVGDKGQRKPKAPTSTQLVMHMHCNVVHKMQVCPMVHLVVHMTVWLVGCLR